MANKYNVTETNNMLRESILSIVRPSIENADFDVLEVGTGKLAIPMVDANGDDRYVTITISIPKGSRDGDEYDGYAMAQEYADKCKEKARKKAEAERIKAEKAAERERKKKEKEAAKEAKKNEKQEGEEEEG